MAQSTTLLRRAADAAFSAAAWSFGRTRPRPAAVATDMPVAPSPSPSPSGFDAAVRVSEAMQRAAAQGAGALNPALSGCRDCDIVQMIAAPTPGVCDDCGAELQVLEDGGSARPL